MAAYLLQFTFLEWEPDANVWYFAHETLCSKPSARKVENIRQRRNWNKNNITACIEPTLPQL